MGCALQWPQDTHAASSPGLCLVLLRTGLGLSSSSIYQEVQRAQKVWGSNRDGMVHPHLFPGMQSDVAFMLLCLNSSVNAVPSREEMSWVSAWERKKRWERKLNPQGWEEELIEGSWEERRKRNVLGLFEAGISDCSGCPIHPWAAAAPHLCLYRNHLPLNHQRESSECILG